ncbi:hypothetical protein CR513_37647, partial [Mucuna pruriens]
MGTKLKCLRIDNDMEFVSEQFNKLYKKLYIQRHKINGLAEGMNRTILERGLKPLWNYGMELLKLKCAFIGYPTGIK